jgi:glutamate/aspartate transport system permease protein
MKIAQRDSRVVEMYTLVAVVYFVLSFLLSQGVKRLHQRIAIVR